MCAADEICTHYNNSPGMMMAPQEGVPPPPRRPDTGSCSPFFRACESNPTCACLKAHGAMWGCSRDAQGHFFLSTPNKP
jgi:hypothetical protein